MVLKKYDYNDVIDNIERIVTNYNLSQTSKHSYDYYGCNSSTGLGSFNKEGYLKLRDTYNALNDSEEKIFMFFVLIIYSFNNQIRFNNKGLFNLPVGKRDLNVKMKKKIEHFCDALKNNNIKITNNDFESISPSKNDFVYLDPPYLLGTASYNENNGWTEEDEIRLYTFLEKLHRKGVRFALSNVIEHKGFTNKYLSDFVEKNDFKCINISKNYNNSNYQANNKNYMTQEVLVTNY